MAHRRGTTQSVLIDNEDIVALMADGNAYAGIDGDFHHVRARKGEAYTGKVCFLRYRYPIRDVWARR